MQGRCWSLSTGVVCYLWGVWIRVTRPHHMPWGRGSRPGHRLSCINTFALHATCIQFTSCSGTSGDKPYSPILHTWETTAVVARFPQLAWRVTTFEVLAVTI